MSTWPLPLAEHRDYGQSPRCPARGPRTWGQPWLGGFECDLGQWTDALIASFARGVDPQMAKACAWLSLDAQIVFAIAQLIQPWRCLTYSRHLFVETPLVRSKIANGHVACLVRALHV